MCQGGRCFVAFQGPPGPRVTVFSGFFRDKREKNGLAWQQVLKMTTKGEGKKTRKHRPP